jgi:hypothetical protein
VPQCDCFIAGVIIAAALAQKRVGSADRTRMMRLMVNEA